MRHKGVRTLTPIGGVGVSLFLLGLEITFPPPSHLSLGNLFEVGHLPLLVASAMPAIFLSISIRVGTLVRCTRSLTKHALYMPLFCVAVAVLFWIVVAICGNTDTTRLASAGWLFTVDAPRERRVAAQAWNYWALFDFTLIEWHAMSAGLSQMVLLVVVGALSLPVLVPLAAKETARTKVKEATEQVQTQYNMNREFLAHALSNLGSGMAGTVPNLMVRSAPDPPKS